MRLFLLPISTKQSIIYCQRINQQLSQKAPSILDRITTRATTTWLSWEKKEKGWQKKITSYGNALFQRLPYEEYGLKTIPPLSERRKSDEIEGKEAVQVEYPLGLIEEVRVQEALRKLGGDEKQAFHTKWFIGSLIGMPISAPFALVPVIPNLPFFYLCFRAWSHWRARSGSKHLEFLLEKKLIELQPSRTLQNAYTEATMDASIKQIDMEVKKKKTAFDTPIDPDVESSEEEQMLLSASSGAAIAQELRIPEIQMEIDRAVWQVERAVSAHEEKKKKKKKKKEAEEEKAKIESTQDSSEQRR